MRIKYLLCPVILAALACFPAATQAKDAAGAGLLGGVLSGGEDKAGKELKKEEPRPAPGKAAVSSETVKAEPVRLSTRAAAGPLYSAGKGPRIAVVAFEGESGAEFAALLSAALSPDLKVYSPEELAAKAYDAAAITRVSARKIAMETAVDYVVTGKVSKKSGTLSIISLALRDGRTGDTKMTDNHSLRAAGDLKPAAETAAGKIKVMVAQ